MPDLILPDSRLETMELLYPKRKPVGNTKVLKSINSKLYDLSKTDSIDGFTTVGTPSLSVNLGGKGRKFGLGSYFNSEIGIIQDSNGAGNQADKNFSITIIFSSLDTSNDPFFSFGITATDASPKIVLRNLSGSINLFGYSTGNIDVIEPGKVRIFTLTYSDLSPYTSSVFLDGKLVRRVAGYKFGIKNTRCYVGSGYNSQSTTTTIYSILMMQHEKAIWSDSTIFNFHHNPYQFLIPA